ncbi:MAG: PD-(D/E)XK nuclease family protein [Candidatus Nomurabacteria bacterium]|nr:PD-(D/E)XK nuclease family protein [Candidatus Nomurabacteria bacterium]
MADKYTAVWVSHSSMGDFLKCPRLYYLHNMYKDPSTGRKMSIVTPHMSLGIAVHEVLEGLGDYPANERMKRDLRATFEEEWLKVTGIRGGFTGGEMEEEFKLRGKEMINNVIKDPKFLVNKRIKLPKEKMNPNYYLSEDDNIILNGQIDWIEYLEDDTLHIVDFKTGKNEEKDGSLQLPIYLLLCNALQKRKVTRASYWYLESDKMVEKELPDLEKARRDVYDVALRVKIARYKNEFSCINGKDGCMNCKPYEKILDWNKKTEDERKNDESVISVGIGGFNQDLFVIK